MAVRVLAHESRSRPQTLQDLLGHSSIVVTADTYTSVLPQIQRRCADATAQLVLNAARRTRRKIKASARKNRPDRGPKAGTPGPTTPKTGAPTPPKRKQATKLQVTSRLTRDKAASGAAPTSHPRDTHHPHRPHSTKGLIRVSAAQTLHDLARPKGFEPLTF
ncbi:hypothetical protein [Salinispora arenicola]|uniref:hypothetical protein n=1 Tax=Salinispora arenicola TaxID=168697 RepID=UPI0009B744C4|nr:hypothetical protein [Salinispora arenicola]